MPQKETDRYLKRTKDRESAKEKDRASEKNLHKDREGLQGK